MTSDDRSRRLLGTLAELVPDGVEVGSEAIDAAHIEHLLPGELAVVAGAIDTRRAEFASGRALLHRILDTGSEILVRSDRSPRLPDGWVGSLAHDHATAVAVAARSDAFAALGVDIEADAAISPEESALILRAEESDLDPILALVLKEATYKCWNGLGGAMLEFHDVRLEIGDGTFRAAVLRDAVSIAGRWASRDGVHLAVAAVAVSHRDDGITTPS